MGYFKKNIEMYWLPIIADFFNVIVMAAGIYTLYVLVACPIVAIFEFYHRSTGVSFFGIAGKTVALMVSAPVLMVLFSLLVARVFHNIPTDMMLDHLLKGTLNLIVLVVVFFVLLVLWNSALTGWFGLSFEKSSLYKYLPAVVLTLPVVVGVAFIMLFVALNWEG